MIEPFPVEGIYAITPSFKNNELAYLEKIEETVRAGVAALQIREKYSWKHRTSLNCLNP